MTRSWCVASATRRQIIRWLRFHALLWPLERARVVLEPAYDGIDVSFERASWGGVPIRGRARWESGSFRAVLTASPPEPEERAPETGPGWGRGRLTIGPVSKGSWRFTGISARFQGEGDTIHLNDVSVHLHPRGRALGSLALDLSQPDSVPLRVSFAVRDGDVQELGEAIGMEPAFATGTLQLAGSFEGRLRPEAPLFAEISGLLSLDAREGRVNRKLPLVVAIATSEALNPFAGSRRSIRYDTAEAVLDFERGRVSSDAFVLRGPDMRVLAYGSLDLTDPMREIDAVAAVFYQGKLDRVIGAIPLVNELLRGSDESLAAAYVKIEGPMEEPSVKMIPMKTFASLGPAGFVLEDVPNMLRSGLRALQSLFDSDGDTAQGQAPTSSLARPARSAS